MDTFCGRRIAPPPRYPVFRSAGAKRMPQCKFRALPGPAIARDLVEARAGAEAFRTGRPAGRDDLAIGAGGRYKTP